SLLENVSDEVDGRLGPGMDILPKIALDQLAKPLFGRDRLLRQHLFLFRLKRKATADLGDGYRVAPRQFSAERSITCINLNFDSVGIGRSQVSWISSPFI